MRVGRVATGLVLSLATLASPARADDAPKDGDQNQPYRPLIPADYGLLGIFGVTGLYFSFGLDPASEAAWVGPILYDDPVRDALRASSRDGRTTANTVSNILVGASYGMLASDALIAGGLSHEHDWGLTWHLTVIDLQTMALSLSVIEVSKAIAARERPDVEPCAADPDYSPQCGVESTESFPSGHSAASATAAGLVCVHHLELGLYGSKAADIGACAATAAAAVTTGALRVVADRHYATDVTAGLLIGAGIGVGFPLLFHTRSARATDTSAARFAVVPALTARSGSLTMLGEF